MRAMPLVMVFCVAAASAFAPPAGAPPRLQSARAASPAMAAERKIYAFDDDTVFEAREVSVPRKPVYLLKAIEDLKVATAVKEAGLLTTAEELGVFSKLEKAGAFSLAEKLLPTIESLKLLTLFEDLLEVESALTFTIANFLIVSGPILFILQLTGFLPFPEGPAIGLEVLYDGASLVGGGALFVTAYIISKLQIAADS